MENSRLKSAVSRLAGVFAASVILLNFSGSAKAATISAGPVELNQPIVGPGTTVGTLGYSFPGTQPGTVENNFYYQPGGPPFTTASLPSYLGVTYFHTLDYYYGTGYANLLVNGASTNGLTGFAYQPGSGAKSVGTAVPLVSITLGAGVPSSFELGFLNDNTNGAADDTSIIVNGTDGSSQTVNSPVATDALTDDFYYVNVTNAAPGDTITVDGYNAGGGPGLGGVVFDSVPEPASLTLLGVAAAPLLLRRRKV